MLLIITSKRDNHVDPVAGHLDATGVPWVRLNTEDFATNVSLSISPADNAAVLTIRDSGKIVDLREVRAVWFRKPEPASVSHFALQGEALDYVEAELNEVLFGLYALLRDATWINNPFTTRIAHRKLLQLKVANDVGFATPRTLVTNDPQAAVAFGEALGTDLAIKSLGAISVMERSEKGIRQYGIFTRRISLADLQRVENKILHMPTLLQEFVEKQYELRITCVGRQIFACRIESRGRDLPADDYRFDTENVEHTAYECPELHPPLRAYMEAFALNFGCFDVLIAKNGQAYFLECNPNGQWLWVEKMTGLPISRAIAEELLSAMHLQPC
jgi:glutathione synthase/RimK-type ligase-like ATP-grasp enzyme